MGSTQGLADMADLCPGNEAYVFLNINPLYAYPNGFNLCPSHTYSWLGIATFTSLPISHCVDHWTLTPPTPVDSSTLTPPTPVDSSTLIPPTPVHTGGWSDLPCDYWAYQWSIWGCRVFGLPYLHRGVPGLPHRICNPLLLQDTLWTSESVASLHATENSSLEKIILVSDNIFTRKNFAKGGIWIIITKFCQRYQLHSEDNDANKFSI